MEREEQKKEVQVNNDMYRERFQFLLSVNDNIICQRYFKVNGFNKYSIESMELKDAIDEIVALIQNDLQSKSRIFLYYTSNEPIKLTGFSEGEEPTYFTYPEEIEDTYSDNERLEPYEVTFKFTFMMDNKVVYERIWDGTDYPKYVRNGVDLTNSDSSYRDREPLSLHFSVAIIRRMTFGREDLVYGIIRKLCEVMSNSYVDTCGSYTRSEQYGDELYYLSLYNKKYIDGWDAAVKDKTREYYVKLYPSARQIERIEKYL